MHLESWLLRAALLATAAFQIVNHNSSGAIVAVQGFVISLVPLLIGRLSKKHVPRPLDFAFTAAIALQYISESTKLFEVFTYWDKIVHPTEVAITSLMAAWLLLGWADAFGKRVPIHLGAAIGLLLGTTVGAVWEFVEFASDWFAGANLQKSNADTMTDVVANDIGAFVATLFALYVFVHVLRPNQRREMGEVAAWIAHGPGVLLERHGRVVGAVALAVFVGVMLAGQSIDRGEPALAAGLPAGQDVAIDFTAPDSGQVQILSGDWIPDARGICRVNLEHPKPGSEKPGLLQVAPASAYGLDGQSFSVEAKYFEQRPEKTDGTEMDAAIAFGIRDDKNYDLLEQSALHDVLRVDRYIHDRRRDVREKLYRTHANEWHVLRVDVAGSNVTASVDGETVFTADNVPNTDGGVGLWARTAAATCFSDVHVTVGGSNP